MTKNNIFENLVVLDIANNHFGDIEHGKKIINEFSKIIKKNKIKAAFKFQFRHLDTFIHKSQLENKYTALLDEHTNLSKKLEEIQNNEILDQKKQAEFSEKIDELNQETDTLLEEVDKWQI